MFWQILSWQVIKYGRGDFLQEICIPIHSKNHPVCKYVGGIKVFTPDTTTTIYWTAFQIKKRGLLTSIHAFCPADQSET
jgi:hypothetical protein